MNCNEYDYIEIACLYQYPIKLTTKIGDIFHCKALDTQYNQNREECIKVNIEGDEQLIILNDLSTLEICIKNPHFTLVSFS